VVFDDSNKGTYMIAQCDDRIVGSLLTIPEWSDWRNGTVLWITEPAVETWTTLCRG